MVPPPFGHFSRNSISQRARKASPAAQVASGKVNRALVLSDVSKMLVQVLQEADTKLGLNMQEFYKENCCVKENKERARKVWEIN